MQLSALTASLGRFLAELQRRKVLRLAAAYAVGAWIVLQVAVALQTAMSLSASFSAAILALLVIGFFVTIVLAWFYEITPEGVKRTAPATGDAPLVKPQTTDLILAGALALVVIVAVVQLLTASPTAPPAAAPATTAEATPAKPEPPALGDKSIAVLPFANLSPDKDDAYFADGLAEEVLNILAQLHGVRVISRTSSFAFKGKEVGVKDIAKQLAVRHVLEGSVRRDGDDIRVTAQLIDTEADTHVWSQTFERKLADVFTVQDEIARAIAGALNIELSLSAGVRSAPTANMEAYRLYLKARERTIHISKENLLEGIELYKRAIALDPKFAEAYANMASVIGGFRIYDPANGAALSRKANEAANAAIKLKPDIATARAVLGSLASVQLKWEAAEGDTLRALELEPSNSYALGSLGHIQLALGFIEKATRTFEDVARTDPLFSLGPLRSLLVALASGDNSLLAERALKLQSAKGLAAFAANCSLAIVAKEKGDTESAERYFRECVKPYPRNKSIVEPVSRAIKDPAWRARAIKALLEEHANDPSLDSENYYLLIGATDEFLDAVLGRLESKSSQVSTHMAFVWHLVARGEGANPKLKELMRRVGLVDYWKKHGWPDRCRAKGEDDFECS